MRKPLLLLLATLGATWSSAQAQNTLAEMTYEAAQRQFAPRTPLDSTFNAADAARAVTVRRHTRLVSYDWLTGPNQWTTAPYSSALTYTPYAKLLQAVTVDSATRVLTSRQTYSYNSPYQAAGYIVESWVNPAWQNALQVAWTYDNQGRVLSQTSQVWTNGAWTNSSRFQYGYDAQGRQTAYANQTWTNGAWKTLAGYQIATLYDAQNRLTEETQSNWNSSSQAYGLGTRYQYAYTGTAPVYSSSVLQNWVNNAWANSSRFTAFSYDAQNRVTYYETQSWTNAAWETAFRTTTTYAADANSALTQNLTSTGWVDYTRTTRTSDINGAALSNYTESWLNGSWQLTAGARYTDAYNATNDLTRRLYQRVDAVNHVFVNANKYYYSDFQSFVLASRPAILTAQASLYPNPATDMATLQISGLHQTGSVSVTVLNSLGRSVRQLSSRVQPGTFTLPLSVGSLPAGLYTVQVRTAEGTAVQRLVKQ